MLTAWRLPQSNDPVAPAWLAQGVQVFDRAIQHVLVQSAGGQPCKVRRLSVRLPRRLVGVLLINQHRIRLALHRVRHVGDTPRFPPRGRRQFPQNSGDGLAILWFEAEPNKKRDQANTSSKPPTVIVCARSGPVEIMPIFAPDSRSMKCIYCCAAIGS